MPSSKRKKQTSRARRKPQPAKRPQWSKPRRKLARGKPNNFMVTGIALVALSVIILLSLFYPILRAEFSYLFSGNKNVKVVGKSEATVPVGASSQFEVMKPANENFGIVIPKIKANAKVLPNVDAENSAVYQKALTQGVAHAKGTKLPGQEGNIFIFAHSGQDFLEANRYNAVFYLLSKLETGDEIFIFYQNKKFRYLVTEKKTASPEEAQYMDGTPGKKTLTLMTCWPGGTTWKRLIVRAEQS